MSATNAEPNKPKLLDRVRAAIRAKHYSHRTEEAYVQWILRFILFHKKRHPAEMGELEINQFLTHLAVKGNVASSTQNQALSAILFLYREVLKREIGRLDEVTWAKKPETLPVVMTKEEVKALMDNLSGVDWLMAMLLYGCGLRLVECLKLRVKDIDFSRSQIAVRHGKGAKDRLTPLPKNLIEPLQKHLAAVKKQHDKDLANGFGAVDLPYALERKYPGDNREFGWQYFFPSAAISPNRISGMKQRHHTSERGLQRAFHEAVRKAGINKHVYCHTLRHCFATHVLEAGCDVRTLQELSPLRSLTFGLRRRGGVGHADLNTTMIYTHVTDKGTMGVQSPAETLWSSGSDGKNSQWNNLSDDLKHRFTEVVTRRYQGNWNAAVTAFIKSHERY
jgi:integron integrase